MINLADVDKFADLARNKFSDTFVWKQPYRYCLELFHAAIYSSFEFKNPSLEIGIHDGVASAFVNYFKKDFTFGGDMPFESTKESCDLRVRPRMVDYKNYILLNMEEIPFPENSFRTIYTSETLFYGMNPNQVLREFNRVLAPGGAAYIFNATDVWASMPALLERHMKIIPTLRFWPRSNTLSILKDIGAEILVDRYFLGSGLEALLQTLQGEVGTKLIEALDADPVARNLVYRTIEDYVRLELSRDDGPPDSFHHAFAFRKPGASEFHMPRMEDPKPSCPVCGGSQFDVEFAQWECRSCARTFPVIRGKPFLSSNPGRAFSPKYQSIAQQNREFQSVIEKLEGSVAADAELAIFGPTQLMNAVYATLMSRGRKGCFMLVYEVPKVRENRERQYILPNELHERKSVTFVMVLEDSHDRLIESLIRKITRDGAGDRFLIVSLAHQDGENSTSVRAFRSQQDGLTAHA